MTNDEILADGCLSVPAAAKFLGTGQTFLYAEMSAGRLRYCKLGRRRLLPKNELVRFAAAGLTGGFALGDVEHPLKQFSPLDSLFRGGREASE